MILAHKENIFLRSLLLVLICRPDVMYCCSSSSDESSTPAPSSSSDETSTPAPDECSEGGGMGGGMVDGMCNFEFIR